jgi:hypothetical protein
MPTRATSYTFETRVLKKNGNVWRDAGTMGSWFGKNFGDLDVTDFGDVCLHCRKQGELRATRRDATPADVAFYVLD